MSKENLACDPKKFKDKSLKEITLDLGYYAAEHGFSPENLGQKGIFLIGYQYLAHPPKNSFLAINPYDNQPLAKDVRDMFDTTSLRGRLEKQGFEKLVAKIFSSPPKSFFIWISPPDPYPWPRIYFGQLDQKNEDGSFSVDAFDFNNDFSQEELAAILSFFDPTINPTVTKDFILNPVIIPNQEEKTFVDLLTQIETVVRQKRKEEKILIHRVPFKEVKNQLKHLVWQEKLKQFKVQGEYHSQIIYQAIKNNRYHQALLAVADFEIAIAKKGGFFAPDSSCGRAIFQFLNQGFNLRGLPTRGVFLNLEPFRSTCPICGQPLPKPIAIGECCPWCGTERRC